MHKNMFYCRKYETYTKFSLTPASEFTILLSCPDCEENDIFKLPGPISTVSFCVLSVTSIYPLLSPVWCRKRYQDMLMGVWD